jgi:hypothetical protein
VKEQGFLCHHHGIMILNNSLSLSPKMAITEDWPFVTGGLKRETAALVNKTHVNPTEYIDFPSELPLPHQCCTVLTDVVSSHCTISADVHAAVHNEQPLRDKRK